VQYGTPEATAFLMGIDATKKPVGEPFSEVCEVPLDLLKKMKIEDYFS